MKRKLNEVKFVTKTGAVIFLVYYALGYYHGDVQLTDIIQVLGEVLMVLGLGRKLDRINEQDSTLEDEIRKNQ